MINPNQFNAGAMRMFIGDNEVGELESIKVEPMKVEPIKGYGGVITLTDTRFNAERFMDLLMAGSGVGFDITVNELIPTASRKPRSKKKRIQKKWLKKVTTKRTTYKGCEITGVTTGRFSAGYENKSNRPRSESNGN